MAGIGFELKKIFKDETYINRTKAYLYSALVAAGPWIAAVITVNLLLFIMNIILKDPGEKELFMGTIVYSFIFSQIFTAPWQMIITRYVSDRLYVKEYQFIRPSFLGLSKIVTFLSLIGCIIFYYDKGLPLYYKIFAGYLFLIITLIWIIMVYLSAVKNYSLIAKAYIYGGITSIVLIFFFLNNLIPFPKFIYGTNLLLAYLAGLTVTYIMLAYNFLATFYYGNNLEYDFFRYLNKFPSLFFVGLFYTLGLWIDDILMWFSVAGVIIYETYTYAPIYDNAVFLAYLTTIPTTVLFLVSVETDFYDTYKKYYGLANGTGTIKEINSAKKEMQLSLFYSLLYTFEVQALISFTIILLSPQIFNFLNISVLIRNIFRVCALGALFNIFILVLILIFLYFESRIQALFISFLFFISNLTFTEYFIDKGIKYYGYGFTLGAFISFIAALLMMVNFLKNINFKTFNLQRLFVTEDRGFFTKLARVLNQLQAKTKEEINYINNHF